MTKTETRRLLAASGTANVDLTIQNASLLGQAIGIHLNEQKGADGHRPLVVVTKDTRRSNYALEPAIVAGLISTGMRVETTGPLPRAALTFLTASLRASMGVMLSAGELPYEQNAIRLYGSDGMPLPKEVLAAIQQIAIDPELAARIAASSIGRAKRIDAQGRYLEYVKASLPRELRFKGLRVVIDCAHGAAYQVAPEILHELDAEVIAINVEPDGTNINHECGATSPGMLCRKVQDYRADIGIALSGDGSTVVLADEFGKSIDQTRVTTLLEAAGKKPNGDGLANALQVMALLNGRKVSEMFG